jgi:hypothetical protein
MINSEQADPVSGCTRVLSSRFRHPIAGQAFLVLVTLAALSITAIAIAITAGATTFASPSPSFDCGPPITDPRTGGTICGNPNNCAGGPTSCSITVVNQTITCPCL